MKNKLNIWKILFLLFLMAGSIYIIRNNQAKVEQDKAAKNWKKIDHKGNRYASTSVDEHYINNYGNVFGTYYSITYRSGQDMHEAIRDRLADVDNSLSPFNKRSLITAVNENRDTIADEMFTAVFTLAQEVSSKTSGAFDITVAPLVNAWGFGFKNNIAVDSCTIDSIMRYVGYTGISLNDGKIIKSHPETMLNCSAIAKGYGCDVIATLLTESGINDFLVEIGGEVVAKGNNPKGKNWTIGISKPIDDPTGKAQEYQTIINASGKGLATSGNYRNYRLENGKKIAHTIDPRTGYPVTHSLLSATVIAADCATADAYATAFMVLGVEAATQICKENNDIEAYFIYTDESGNLATSISEGFQKYILK
ncbi:MAG: FAD:protein FMN transferase [Bacteroidaceae bacterium]|nr:FAD:protein FMN transferase [Bacteroidaceae bacterium]